MHYEMGNPFRRAKLLYRLPHSFSLRGRGQISGFDPLPRKIRCRRARRKINIENVDITTEIRPDTRKFSFGIAPLESA